MIGCIVMGAILQRAVLFIDEQVCWCRAELVRQARVGSAWQRRANYTAPILDFFEPPLSAWYRCLELRVALACGGWHWPAAGWHWCLSLRPTCLHLRVCFLPAVRPSGAMLR